MMRSMSSSGNAFIGIMCHVGIDVGTNTTAPKILMERLGWTLNEAAFATLFASGTSLDETYGLIEVIEKAAMIYSQIGAQGGVIKQAITDQELQEIATFFNMTPHQGFLDVD